jgi:hypothetical protein
VRVVLVMMMNCFVASPPASSVRVPVNVAAAVGEVYTPGRRVVSPSSDDGSAAVDVLDRALSPSQWLLSLADTERRDLLVVSR